MLLTITGRCPCGAASSLLICLGSRAQNVEPLPSTLSTPTLPPMASASWRVSASPNPDIQSSAAHMNALVEQLMDLAKVQGGHISLHAEPFAMDDVVQQVGRMLRPQLEAGALRFGAVVEPGARDVVQDPFRVRQILLNYIGNAVKYTPREGAIHVHVHAPEPEWISIDVEDTGAGIAQADLERLFRDYGQVDRDRARARRGTGMGLALVKAVTEALGGHVAVRSTLGQGSVFTARLPRTLSWRGA